MLHSGSSVLQTKLNTDIWYNTGRCTLFYYVIFRQERFIDSIETNRLKRDYSLLTVCALSLPPNEAIISRTYKKNPISNILYSCLIYWLEEQWLFIDIVIIIMHWQQGPYTVFMFYVCWFFSMTGTFFFFSFLFQWSALISNMIVEHNSSLRGRSVCVCVGVCARVCECVWLRKLESVTDFMWLYVTHGFVSYCI